MRIAISIAALLLATLAAGAQAPGQRTGNAIIAACKAFVDAPHEDFTQGYCAGVVVKHLEDNPAQLHRTFTFFAADALEKGFPCPR